MSDDRVKPGKSVHLRDHDPRATGEYSKAEAAAKRTEELRGRLGELQELLYAEQARSLLVVLQGIDTSGKDGTIRHVMSGVNPQGCVVTSFKVPTPQEQAHDFLWRVHAACPPRGYIGIFNRSHYEDVLVTRVHGSITEEETERRLREICDFEKMLVKSGTTIVKFFLHISKDEQKRRLLARIDDKSKRWKFSENDLKERGYWRDYRRAFEHALSATSTNDAPWYVVPANHHWYRNVFVAERIVRALEELKPRPRMPRGVDWSKLRRAVQRS
jgi:PPK2 family polyphosphate:nucleotide phosphotransferase